MGDVFFEIKNLSKTFPGVRALHNADFTIKPGEVVGLVGENGAGKSTLLNIVSGIYKQSGGKMFLRGVEYTPSNYHSATKLGVSRVFQELALVPNLTVYENIFLSHESNFSKYGVISKKEMAARAAEMLASFNLHIDPTKPVSKYSFSLRQAIEIAKACTISAELFKIPHPLILLDEPTTSLTGDEVETFFQLVDKVKKAAALVFVSHRLTEVLSLTDRIYVLKDGEVVKEVSPKDVDQEALHELMVGRKRDQDYYQEHDQQHNFGKKIFSVKNFSDSGRFENISFEAHAGEILGIGGLIGSGKTELGKALIGAVSATGELEYNGENMTRRNIGVMIKKGVGYIPQERNVEGIITSFTIKWNITLSSIADVIGNTVGFLFLSRENAVSNRFMKLLAIKARNAGVTCQSLSGGNQQKVILAKWLMRDLKVLIMDNPTRGIDAGAKEEIYKILRREAKKGTCIILITDDLLELIGISNRVLIMKDAAITAEINASNGVKPTEKELVKYMV